MRGSVRLVVGALLGAVAVIAGAQPRAEASPPAEKAPAGPERSAERGLVVVAVDPASPAERAGIRRGDILLKADKIELSSAADLEFYVGRLKAGDRIELGALRGDESRQLTVELGSRNGAPYLGVSVHGAGDDGRFGPRIGPGGDGAPGTVPWQRMLGAEALVAEVLAGSPAEASGLARGDRILSIGDVALTGGGSLGAELAKRKPGDKVVLEVRRAGGAVEKVEVTLAPSPDDRTKPYLGIRYQEVPSAERVLNDLAPGLRGGIVVRDVAAGSPAEKAGIEAGDLITRVGEDRIGASAASLADLVGRRRPGETVQIGLVDRAGGEERVVSVTLGEHPQDKSKAYLGVTTGATRFVVPNDDGQAAPRGRLRMSPRSGATDT